MPHVDTPQSTCRFGIARCDVTPPVGMYHRMWGAATHDRSTGVHRPLTATALVFQAEGPPLSVETEQVIVALDHCLFWAREMEALTGAICRETGLMPEQLAVAFSHTHGAGLIGFDRTDRPGGDLIPAYLEEMGRRVAGIVAEARRAIRPATITYGAGRCGMAAHRDFWDEASQQFVCGYNPGGPVDDTVLVARITDETGQPRATLVNYACHPTTLAWENTLVSPDFAGALREVVEAATGAPCAFLQGASGDIGPVEGFVGDTAVADRNGRQLAYAALAALEALPPPGTRFTYAGPVVSGATLGSWKHEPLDAAARQQKARWRLRRWTVDLPYRPEIPTPDQTRADRIRWQAEEKAATDAGDPVKARDAHAMVERMDRWLTRLATIPPGKSFAFPVTLLQVGDAFWLMVECELYNLFQRALREKCGTMPLVVMTLVNGSRAMYLPTREVYGKGIYQESVAVVEAGSLERLIEEIGEQVQSWINRA